MALQLQAAAVAAAATRPPVAAFERRLPPRPLVSFARSCAASSTRSSWPARLPSRGPAPPRWRRASVRVRAAAGGGRGRRESPYEVLGVSPSAAPDEIKRAYRRLALKFHPDVNKEANAQEKFLRIKHAYNTLMNSESRSKYASTSSDSSWNSSSRESKSTASEEQFYGFADFLKDLQAEFQNWEAGLNSDQKPQSLWDELAAIGEEFVEFLENELKIDDSTPKGDSGNDPYTQFGGTGKSAQADKTPTNSFDDGLSEIEATLEKLKKELGLG
ncbi:hypothetical protein ACP4OV_008464 [Aristida adscensionis]